MRVDVYFYLLPNGEYGCKIVLPSGKVGRSHPDVEEGEMRKHTHHDFDDGKVVLALKFASEDARNSIAKHELIPFLAAVEMKKDKPTDE